MFLARRPSTLAVLMVLASIVPGGEARAQAPLSAIDWLRESPATEPGAYPVTPPSQDGWLEGAITTRALDAVNPESVGLFSAARVGLPRGIWGPSEAVELAALMRGLSSDILPALRDLGYLLLMAEFDAPSSASTPTEQRVPPLLAARLDKLYEFGAIDQAAALLDTLELQDPALRLRRFEIALLLGEEQSACESVIHAPESSELVPAVIYCLARLGEWQDAADRLTIATTEGTLRAPYDTLLARFLDDDEALHGDEPQMPPRYLPTQLSPLSWRILEAIGESVATHGLPVAFAHADLRGTIGWRAQLEAAERLTRTGAMAANQLLGLYTQRSAAASGGIWERVRHVQALDSALAGGSPVVVARALERAWPQIVAGELEVPFTALYADALAEVPLTGAAAELAFQIGLLSDSYEAVALRYNAAPGTIDDPDGRNAFLVAIARGLPPPPESAGNDPLKLAIAEAFGDDAPLPEATQARLEAGRTGEEILRQIDRMSTGGDLRFLTEGLAVLRHLGLEDTARRVALQSLLLERRG